MDWYDITVKGSRKVCFNGVSCKSGSGQQHLSPIATDNAHLDEYVTNEKKHLHQSVEELSRDTIGGIFKNGEWAWLVQKCQNSTLYIISVRNGHKISNYDFSSLPSYYKYCVRYVEELYPLNTKSMLLAVGLQAKFQANLWNITLFSIQHSCVLRCIEIKEYISCMTIINERCCRKTLFQNYDGCLAVGTEDGLVILLDLNIKEMLLNRKKKICKESFNNYIFTRALVVDSTKESAEIFSGFKHCRRNSIHFGVKFNVTESPCTITSMLQLEYIFGIALGLQDGRLALCDLTLFDITIMTTPNSKDQESPIKRMSCLLPPNDPKPCFYLCSMRGNEVSLSASLHVFIYEKRAEDQDYISFTNFQTCIICYHLLLETRNSVIIGCQSISTTLEDNDNALYLMGWCSITENKNKILIFDMNQWYKEQMPNTVFASQQPTYLAGYVLNSTQTGLHVQINVQTLAHFNSVQRREEHFYPNSLSFDCELLVEDSCEIYNWEGAQNRFINLLRTQNATIFLDPQPFHKEIERIRLLPEFCEENKDSTFSRTAIYEVILSVALENNCYNLLRDCVRSWVDGGFTSNLILSTDLSLLTLTSWICKRANRIKGRCTEIWEGLLDSNGYPLVERKKKELTFITRQLRVLANLLIEILRVGKSSIPTDVYLKVVENEIAVRLASDYQELINWFISIGLLPESPPETKIVNFGQVLPGLHYPYGKLTNFYSKKRSYFNKLSEQFVISQTGTSRLLFIDLMLHHYNCANKLSQFWVESGGKYPPLSIEALLRIMLVPNLEVQQKCAVVLYFLLDLNAPIDEKLNDPVMSYFIQFQNVFKLSASLVKTIETFWSLDHGYFNVAVEQFLSPINNMENSPTWEVELLVEALLTQNEQNLALSILEAHPGGISDVLKLKTLMANEMITKAFHFARTKELTSNRPLLELFFSSCFHASKFDVFQNLMLNERESQVVQKILRQSKTPGAQMMHFAYLLKKSKYIEAVSYMDELSRTPSIVNRSGESFGCKSMDNNPNLLINAYSTTMAPITQNITEVYFRIRNKIRMREVNNAASQPFSCQLTKHNANNLLGGIYHSSALSAHFATYYWGDMTKSSEETTDTADVHLLDSINAPFLRKSQNETSYLDLLDRRPICYPTTYQKTEKRTREIEEVPMETSQKTQPHKRRRLCNEQFMGVESHFVTPKISENVKTPTTINLFHTIENNTHETTRPNMPSILKLSPNTLNFDSSVRSKFQSQLHSAKKIHRFQLPTLDLTHMKYNGGVKQQPEKEKNNVNNDFDMMPHKDTSHTISQSLSTNRKMSNNNDFDSQSTSMNNTLGNEMDSSALVGKNLVIGPKARASLEKIRSILQTETLTNTKIGSIENAELQIHLQISDGMTPVTLNSIQQSTDFNPSICSSKVCDTQTKFDFGEVKSSSSNGVQLSERTTVVGSLTSEISAFPCIESNKKTPFELRQQTGKTNDLASATNPQILDTTLGMSTLDCTIFKITDGYDSGSVDDRDDLLFQSSSEYKDQFKSQTSQASENNVTTQLFSNDEHSKLFSNNKEEIKPQSQCHDDLPVSSPGHLSDDSLTPWKRNEKASNENLMDDTSHESSLSRNFEDSVPDFETNAESVPPSIESSVNSSTMHSSTSLEHRVNSPKADVAISHDSSSSGSLPIPGYRMVYRLNNLETIYELDTPKESGDEEIEENGDFVLALAGTEEHEYISSETFDTNEPVSNVTKFDFNIESSVKIVCDEQTEESIKQQERLTMKTELFEDIGKRNVDTNQIMQLRYSPTLSLDSVELTANYAQGNKEVQLEQPQSKNRHPIPLEHVIIIDESSDLGQRFSSRDAKLSVFKVEGENQSTYTTNNDDRKSKSYDLRKITKKPTIKTEQVVGTEDKSSPIMVASIKSRLRRSSSVPISTSTAPNRSYNFRRRSKPNTSPQNDRQISSTAPPKRHRSSVIDNGIDETTLELDEIKKRSKRCHSVLSNKTNSNTPQCLNYNTMKHLEAIDENSPLIKTRLQRKRLISVDSIFNVENSPRRSKRISSTELTLRRSFRCRSVDSFEVARIGGNKSVPCTTSNSNNNTDSEEDSDEVEGNNDTVDVYNKSSTSKKRKCKVIRKEKYDGAQLTKECRLTRSQKALANNIESQTSALSAKKTRSSTKQCTLSSSTDCVFHSTDYIPVRNSLQRSRQSKRTTRASSLLVEDNEIITESESQLIDNGGPLAVSSSLPLNTSKKICDNKKSNQH